MTQEEFNREFGSFMQISEVRGGIYLCGLNHRELRDGVCQQREEK